jgi:hypothetical protein
VILARVEWVTSQFGHAGMARVLEAMPREQAHAVKMVSTLSEWAPFDAYVALGMAIDTIYGSGDLTLCRVLGRYAAEVNLPLVYRVFYKFGSVHYLLGKAASVWSAHYDSGSASTHRFDGGIGFTVHDFATPHPVHCLGILGWAEQSVALTGATVTEADEPKCRTRGDDVCDFRIEFR